MKLLYYYSKLNIGGAESSTVRLLNAMNARGHDVTLLLRWDGGELENKLDAGVRVIHLKHTLKSDKKIIVAINSVLQKFFSFFRAISLGKTKYDAVVSGLFGYDPFILFKCTRARCYCQMLRNDVAKTGQYGKTPLYMKRYGDKFDWYIGVSKYTTQSFVTSYPDLKNKAVTIYNILPHVNSDEKRAMPELMMINHSQIRILTVCRIADKAKAVFRLERVCKRLDERFHGKFRWFIVGDGPDKAALRELIKKDEIEDTLILCPHTTDPFPYYYHADLVAVLSYYEGLCGVVNEAKLMERPVLATEFSGIREQIIDGVNGIVVANDEDEIYKRLLTIVENPDVLDVMRNNLMPEELLDNDLKIDKFESLIEVEK